MNFTYQSQAPDDVAELGLGADPAQEARQRGLRRRAARATALERAQEDELLAEALDVVATHDVSSPLFLFYSSHLVHMPLQAPSTYVDRFAFIANSYRRLNHAMGAYLDAAVGSLVAASCSEMLSKFEGVLTGLPPRPPRFECSSRAVEKNRDA